jgi:mannose/fructose/N-acetylgalactosamine-specific phosphotransferase system component IIC
MAVIVRQTEMVVIGLTAHAGTVAVIIAVAAQAAIEMAVSRIVHVGSQIRQIQMTVQRHRQKLRSNVILLAESTAATALAKTEEADVRTIARVEIETLADEIEIAIVIVSVIGTATGKKIVVLGSEISSVIVAETVLATRIDLQGVNETEAIPETVTVIASAPAVNDLPLQMETTTKPDV